MGKPAARLGDNHLCTLPGPPPHMGGVISGPCAAAVTAGIPASAKLGDLAICVGPPDNVIQGSATVIIDGMPAARRSDATAHGGRIAQGLDTVEIGGPTLAGVKVGNSVIAFDKATNSLYVVSYLEYSGPGASAAYAAHAQQQIQDMWSGQQSIRGKPGEVTVQVHTRLGATGTPTPGYDQIAVDPATARSSQTLGGGPGWQNPTDADPGNFVAAHEYGHTVGVTDQYIDTPHGSVPDPTKTAHPDGNIMCQTWPDPSTGTLPKPNEEHYNEILSNAGL